MRVNVGPKTQAAEDGWKMFLEEGLEKKGDLGESNFQELFQEARKNPDLMKHGLKKRLFERFREAVNSVKQINRGKYRRVVREKDLNSSMDSGEGYVVGPGKKKHGGYIPVRTDLSSSEESEEQEQLLPNNQVNHQGVRNPFGIYYQKKWYEL